MHIIKNRRVCFMGTANLRLISQSGFAAHFKINRQKSAAHFAITLYYYFSITYVKLLLRGILDVSDVA